MKKMLFTMMAVVAILACGCQKEENINPTNNERKPDITPYLGKYLMTRTTDLTINVQGMFQFPVDRDLDVETVTIAKDPNQEYGIIMTSSDGLYIKGTVDTLGLHLQNDTIHLAIDTLGIDASVLVTMTHPVISVPDNGVMTWTSTAQGSATVAVPILGNLTATITGNMKYRTVASN